jgi:hypothetical protein
VNIMRTRLIPRTVLVAAVLVLTGAACSDDAGGGPAPAVKPYCKLAVALNKQEAQATTDQVDELVAAAPQEIKDDIRSFADAVATKGQAAYDDPEVQAVDGRIVAFDQRECGIKPLP